MTDTIHTIDPATGRAALGGRARGLSAASRLSPLDRALTPPDGVMTSRVYLAGKITKNGWRSEFVPGLRLAGGTQYDDVSQPVDIGDGIAYMGPFFVSCDHGCTHGKQMHALLDGGCVDTVQGDGWTWKHGGDDEAVRTIAARRCLDQIEKSDIVIAVIRGDAHGTLVEVGYACALRKRVIVATTHDCGCIGGNTDVQDEDFSDQGAWFPFSMPMTSVVCCAKSAMARLRKIMAERRQPNEETLCESPVEVAFLKAMRRHPPLAQFRPNVKVMGGKYRIDFADDERKIGVEIDGHAYHSDKETFAKDRVRQRELEVDGWRIVRYSGQEVHRDADKCVADFRSWLAAVA